MFCFKCGTEIPNGSKFCEKCGASLADGNVMRTPGGEPAKAVQQPVSVPADASKKKKRKKWPFILGGAVLLFLLIVIVAIGGGDDPESQSVQSSTEVNLSETYTNDEEGFSFKYPSGWKPISEERIAELIGSVEDEYPLVLLANEIEDMPEENTYIMVSKFDVEQDAIDHLFVEDEQFAETFDKEASIKDTSVTELDSVSARKIIYVDSDGLGYESYFYAVDSILYRIDFVWKGESAGNSQPFFDAVIGSYKITSDKKNEIVKTDSYNGSPDSIEENEESAVQDRINIGETQVIDNDYDNLKVTLDYAEFLSCKENAYAAGGYEYPNEGNVFLNVVFTVENIGKKPGGVYLAGSNVIYDGEYEFSHKYEEGESTVDIAPLTSPITSMLIFEVPKEVLETDKALTIYLDGNYVNSDTGLSFTIREGSSASDEGVNNIGNFEENVDAQEETEASDDLGNAEDDNSIPEGIDSSAQQVPYEYISGHYFAPEASGAECSLSMYSSVEDEKIGTVSITYNGQEYSGEIIEVKTNVYRVLTTDGTEILFGIQGIAMRGPWMNMSVNGEVFEMDMDEAYVS